MTFIYLLFEKTEARKNIKTWFNRKFIKKKRYINVFLWSEWIRNPIPEVVASNISLKRYFIKSPPRVGFSVHRNNLPPTASRYILTLLPIDHYKFNFAVENPKISLLGLLMLRLLLYFASMWMPILCVLVPGVVKWQWKLRTCNMITDWV